MTAIVTWYKMIVGSIPLPLLEVLGRFSYIVGLLLAFCAFGGFTGKLSPDAWIVTPRAAYRISGV